ncbi:DUF3343 domain-containing protein [Desulfonatronovibrio hydrogenovorans]|uniref:DUF3343 domain-containing protein n=1 Tax=Desulfonatronovibrio hydrogenovorans TaxID=53245 RepID=UPI0005586EC9|nr:DUF3343 domain-containing protein [Desulfonatronovibrio hydrogenovorans]
MRFLKSIFAGFSDKTKGLSEKGILVFRHTSEVIRAESLLKEQGLDVLVKGPPPEIQTGCDMVIEFPLIIQLQVLDILEKGRVEPIQVITVQDHLLEPVSLYNVKDFGEYLMVRAANMKITVNKDTLEIVNVSGGGCPDVPFLAEQMVGRNLLQAPEPRSLGQTLCGYSLQLAYEEMKRRCRG